MQVSNNITSFNVWKNYTSNVSSLRKSMSKLSSGSRINNAGDDPSGLAMSERLRTQTRNTSAASSNVENKLNYLQTADSWMQKMHDMLGRMGELAVMANDGTKSSTDTAVLQNEFAQMQDEIKRITGSTSADVTGADSNAAGKFNGIELFQGGDEITQQVGADGGQIFTSTLNLDLSGESTSDIGTGTSWSSMITADSGVDEAEALTTATDFLADLTSAVGADSDGTATTVATTNTATEAAVLLQAIIDDGSSTTAQVTTATTALEAVNTAIDDGYGAETLTNLTAGTDSGGYQQDVTDAQADVDEVGTAVTASIRIDSLDDAETAVTEVNAAIDFISEVRSEAGAEMKRMEHTLDGLRSYEENISSTESRIRDVDVALETSEMSKYNILQQVGTAMMAQANQLPQGVLQLVG